MSSISPPSDGADKNQPLVSVVMPVLNGERYLAEAITSVLRQTLKNFEFIIISECNNSKKSKRILDSFQDSRMRVIQNTSSLGFVESLNLGIREARGKYIARIDADDAYLPKTLETLASCLENNPDIFLCYGRQQSLWGAPSPYLPDHEDIRASLLFMWPMNHPMMWRCTGFAANSVIFDANHAMEDFAFFSEAVHSFKFHNINIFLYIYRISDDSITAKKMTRLISDTREIIVDNLKKLNVILPDEDKYLFQLWENPFLTLKPGERKNAERKLRGYLFEIICKNRELRVYRPDSLLGACEMKFVKQTGKRLFGIRDVLWPAPGFADVYPDKTRNVCHLLAAYTKAGCAMLFRALFRPPYLCAKKWIAGQLDGGEAQRQALLMNNASDKLYIFAIGGFLAALRYVRRVIAG